MQVSQQTKCQEETTETETKNRPDLYAEGSPMDAMDDGEQCEGGNGDPECSISIDSLDFHVTGGIPNLSIKGLKMSGFSKETEKRISAILTNLRNK